MAREDFAVAADGVERATRRILEQFNPDIVFLLNGLFGAEGTMRSLALAQGLRVPTYEMAPRRGCIVLSQGTPAPYYDTDSLWGEARGQSLTPGQHASALALLDGRAHGVGAHESYFDRPEDDLLTLRRSLGIGSGRRVVTLFTNVSWDSATFGRDIGFPSMLDWIFDAVRTAGEQDDVTLVVRVHPGEHRWRTREQVDVEVLETLGSLPDNVRIVPAIEPVSSYALLDLSDLVLTYTTTLGLEAAARGKTVAVAGDTHYRGRGFTVDLEGPSDLAAVLADSPAPPDEQRIELALRYAFMFFFRAMVPFPAIDTRGPWITRVPRTEGDLCPGADPYLDWICDRILDGADFGLPNDLAQ
jgi:hypothetical protein